jgi:cytochrome c-type biogenesis protein CcmH
MNIVQNLRAGATRQTPTVLAGFPRPTPWHTVFKRHIKHLALLLLILPALSLAKEAAPAASDVAATERLNALSAELRCLVCQNESLASSRAPLAEDLRREVRERIAAGDNNAQIIDYLTDRYGDFVTYRPPFKARTLLLWLAPPVLLLLGLLLLLRRIRQRKTTHKACDPAQLAALHQEFKDKTP